MTVLTSLRMSSLELQRHHWFAADEYPQGELAQSRDCISRSVVEFAQISFDKAEQSNTVVLGDGPPPRSQAG
jgi:hypothetical protein